jgi:hypothetical protein
MPFLDTIRAMRMEPDQQQSLTSQSKASLERPAFTEEFITILEDHVQEMEEPRTDLSDHITELELERDQHKAHAATMYMQRNQYKALAELKRREIDKRVLGDRQDDFINAESAAHSLNAENDRLIAENKRLQAQVRHLEKNRGYGSGGIPGFGPSRKQLQPQSYQSTGWETTSLQGVGYSGRLDQSSIGRWSAAPSIVQKVGPRPRASNEEIGGFARS